MTDGNFAYLALVVGSFGIFALTLAYASFRAASRD